MLAVLGFVTILLVLALIMSKKVSTLVALIFVPAITGFIAAFINAPNVIIQAAQAAAEKAGTAYVEPVITFGTRFTKALSILSADYMGKGLSSIVATGVMFIFAILFFSTCSDAGVFDPIINRILKFTGEDPVKVCIGTFLIGCICHLDGSGATTFLIAIPACMPLFQKLKMNLWVEATIVALAAGIMNVMPWGGHTVRAAAAMSGLGYEVTGSELWVGIMPAWIAGLATCLLIAAFLGKKEAKRIAAGIPAQEVTGLTEAKTTNTSNELARSGQDLGDHQKHTLPYAWVASAIMVAVGCCSEVSPKETPSSFFTHSFILIPKRLPGGVPAARHGMRANQQTSTRCSGWCRLVLPLLVGARQKLGRTVSSSSCTPL